MVQSNFILKVNYLCNFILFALLSYNLSLAQQYLDIDFSKPNQIYEIETNKSQQTLVLKFNNNFIELEQFRKTFLCFVVTIEPNNIIDNEIFEPSDQINSDIENCMLKYTQVISIDINEKIEKVYITPVFVNEFKIVSFNKAIKVDTQMLFQYIPTNSKCENICSGGQCSKVFQIKTKCYSCPINRIGVHCGYSALQLEANKQYDVNLKSKSWNFFQVSATATNLNDNFHFLVLGKYKKDTILLSLYWNYNVQLLTDPKNDIPLPSFYISSKKSKEFQIDDIISNQYISSLINQRSKDQNNYLSNFPSYPLIFIISVFNDSEDVDVQLQIADEETYNLLKSQSFGVFDLPAWVFYLMMGFAIVFFIAILCLVRALVKRYQEEQNIRANGYRIPLKTLTVEVVDTYIPKYPFKHIFKAVKKRKQEVLTQFAANIAVETPFNEEEKKKKKIEEEEMCKKVQERCENILSNGECGICLGNFEFDDECRLTICDHIFHVSCFDPWLFKNQNCPYCRTAINEATLKEWKNKTQQYYPLDQTLGSIPTLDNNKIDEANENTQKDKQNENSEEHKKIEKDIFTTDLIKFKQNSQIKNGILQNKPIYFNSLSLQSLYLEDNKNNSISKIDKKQNTFSEINEANFLENQQNNKRKTNRPNTFTHIKESLYDLQNNNNNTKKYSYQNSQINDENSLPNKLPQLEYNTSDLRTIQDSLETEASSRIRQDSQLQYLLSDNFSQNKLTSNDSSSSLSSSDEVNYNFSLQDSILIQSEKNSPSDFQMIKIQLKSSKFLQQNVKPKLDLENILNEDIQTEQQYPTVNCQNINKEQKGGKNQIKENQNLNEEGTLHLILRNDSESNFQNIQNDFQNNTKNEKYNVQYSNNLREDLAKNQMNKNSQIQKNIDFAQIKNDKQNKVQNNEENNNILFAK